MNKTHTPEFVTVHSVLPPMVLRGVARDLLAERDRLKAQVEELRGALEAYHEFGIFVALVRGPSGEDIQPRLAEAQIMARDALAKVSR